MDIEEYDAKIEEINREIESETIEMEQIIKDFIQNAIEFCSEWTENYIEKLIVEKEPENTNSIGEQN